jgi:hypothetical protein
MPCLALHLLDLTRGVAIRKTSVPVHDYSREREMIVGPTLAVV